MSEWQNRSIEERNLLNPAFCAVLLWFAAKGYQEEAAASGQTSEGLPLELAFLALSFVLRGQTRAALPRFVKTSLAAWLVDNPLQRSAVANGSIALRAYVREAAIFGCGNGALGVRGLAIFPNDATRKKVVSYLNAASQEVKDCGTRARFVGRWFFRSGSPSTVMALMGVTR